MMKTNQTFFAIRAMALAGSLMLFGATAYAINPKWDANIKKLEAQDAITSPPKKGILFVGSSTIVGWDVKRFFPGMPVINRGFGGSQVDDVYDYFDRVVAPYDPATIVFYSGDNDLSAGMTTTTVGNNVKLLVKKMRTTFPDARIILIAPKVSIKRWNLWDKYQDVGRIEKEIADEDPKVEFLDTSSKMIGADGQPIKEYFKSDNLHMTEPAYVIWSDMLRPLLKDEATTGTTADEFTSKTTSLLQPVAPGVWMHRSWFRFPNGDTYFSNGLVVSDAGNKTAVLVDTAWGVESTRNLLKDVQEKLNLKVKAAIVTHWHEDKTAGVDVLKARGIPVYAKAETIELCKQNGKPVPDHAIAGLDMPGAKAMVEGLEVIYPGAAHASDNTLVWEPRSKVLLGGCAVRGATDTTPGNLSHADLNAWPESMERVLATYGDRAVMVIPGHGEPGGKELLKHSAELAEKYSRLQDKALGN